MDRELQDFLVRCTPVTTEVVEWGPQLRLRATAYLGQDLPPLRFVTSARAVVLRGESVLVQQDRDSRHVLPGGRRENDESVEATVRREVAEESGWSLGTVDLLGFIHFRHLDPIQPDYRYPYPDFLQLVHAAEATTHSTAARLEDGYEIASADVLLAEVRRLPLTQHELIYLDAAMRIRRPPA